jgi:hypothetical protein
MRAFARFGLLLALVAVLFAAPTQAATITFTTTDLGGGDWQYDYVVSRTTFNAFEGFSLFFDSGLYEALSDESTANPSWFLSVLQPDPGLPDDGIFNAIALVDGASTADPFSIKVKYLGAGSPGSQPFELTLWEAFDPNDPEADPAFIDSLGSGRTTRQSVPEPALLVLLGGGLMALARRRARRSTSTK